MSEQEFANLVKKYGWVAAMKILNEEDVAPLAMNYDVPLPSHIDLVEYIPDTDPVIAEIIELCKKYHSL